MFVGLPCLPVCIVQSMTNRLLMRVPGSSLFEDNETRKYRQMMPKYVVMGNTADYSCRLDVTTYARLMAVEVVGSVVHVFVRYPCGDLFGCLYSGETGMYVNIIVPSPYCNGSLDHMRCVGMLASCSPVLVLISMYW